MDYKELYKSVYDAFLKAIEATGDDYKNLSWFSKNKKAASEQNKEAA